MKISLSVAEFLSLVDTAFGNGVFGPLSNEVPTATSLRDRYSDTDSIDATEQDFANATGVDVNTGEPTRLVDSPVDSTVASPVRQWINRLRDVAGEAGYGTEATAVLSAVNVSDRWSVREANEALQVAVRNMYGTDAAGMFNTLVARVS